MASSRFFGSPHECYVDPDDLDPQFDYDFTNMKDDGQRFKRGGYPYTRPYGWNRIAIKVLDKYPDNEWLGSSSTRTHSTSGEWAVSYHGTKEDNIRTIAKEGYDLKKCHRKLFGPGIYSTPSPKVAEKYATEFDLEGVKYKMILQNRVNLKKSKIVPKRKTDAGAAYFVTQTRDDIRPYGVLLKKVSHTDEEVGTNSKGDRCLLM